MKLVLIIGNSAVGKMSVGQALMKCTGLRLFHNHMTIEPVIEIFGYYDSTTVNRLRQVIFEEFAKSDHYGMIFTFMWAFENKTDWDYVRWLTELFEKQGAQIYCVELTAPQEVRLQRNETANRLNHKASKRDLEASRRRLLEYDRKYRLESLEGELPFENYIKIDNTALEPNEVAQIIQKRFDL